MALELPERLDYLLSWVKEFEFVDQGLRFEDLCDGVIISKILVSVSPCSFSASWYSRIRSGGGISSVHKCFNLNHIVGAISQFFENVIGQNLAIFQLPNVSLIAEKNDVGELLRLLQLVICCAVNGENKEKYIQAILIMERAVQQAIMESVQEVMNETSSKGDELSLMSKSDRDDAFAHKCHELEAKISQLEAEKATAEAELEDALRKIALLEEHSGDSGGIGDGSETVGSVAATLQLRQLQEKLHNVQVELFQAEADSQEAKLRLSEALVTIEDLRKMNEALTLEVSRTAHFKDELDIAREEMQAANRQVASLEQWKKRRAEEMVALRVRCSKLEEDNAACLKVLDELKQANRLNSSLRANAEASRNQSVEANSRVSELELRTMQLEEELKQARADLQGSLRENQTLLEEMRRLREHHEKAFTSTDLEAGDRLSQLQSSLNLPSKPVESNESGDQEITSDAVYEIEQRYRGYLAKALEVIRQLNRRVVAAETAAVNQNCEQKPDSEVSRLQALLAEKESIIEQLERHYEQARRQRDLEDRMVLTAWYHLGMRVNRAHTERLLHEEASSGASSSFAAFQSWSYASHWTIPLILDFYGRLLPFFPLCIFVYRISPGLILFELTFYLFAHPLIC
ncbi:protein hook 3 [Echinococcus multilocularis]|uniref:Protein hook 3 n=1 Tax=Echinococcus multilocularis TaxID=6211 RepID=A0A068YGK0_ECHMU|nr:protein hook 3 [Echinococcus multilocularis]